MSIAQAVYKWHTFVPIRFGRTGLGAPSGERPDLDDRGYRDDEHGPVLGVTADDTVGVEVRRLNIDNSADLWLTSTDAAIASVEEPSSGHLAAGERVVVRVRGHRAAGTTPNKRTAKLQCRFGSSSGPILGELTVWVFRRLTVDITPHMVTIRGTGGSVCSIANVADIMTMVRGIWKPCGIGFNVGATRPEDVTFAAAGIVSDTATGGLQNSELSRLLGTRHVANTINVYFVHRIGADHTLGYGFSRPNATAYHVAQPGIILADTESGGVTRDIQYWANDLAHEVGHFLTLEHAGNTQGPNELEDSWARRMLMHPYNGFRGHDPWPDTDEDGHNYAQRPLLENVGYGAGNRGCLITMKHVPPVQMDAECEAARTCAARSGGPY